MVDILFERTKLHEIKHLGNAYGHVKFSNNAIINLILYINNKKKWYDFISSENVLEGGKILMKWENLSIEEDSVYEVPKLNRYRKTSLFPGTIIDCLNVICCLRSSWNALVASLLSS